VSDAEWDPASTLVKIHVDAAPASSMTPDATTRLTLVMLTGAGKRRERRRTMLRSAHMPDPIVYCLTRDRELAAAVDARLARAIAFFFNDAARLHQAVVLRRPDLVVVDTGAIRREFGDAGLGPVVDFLRERAADARIAVRPSAGADWLVGAEAGEDVEMLPADTEGCISVIATLCGCA
jgi:hypothetical protein